MAGLLDFLNSDEARMGIGLLAAAGPQTDPTKTGFGQRLEMGIASADAAKKAALMNKYYESQMLDNSSQAEYRSAQVNEMKRKTAFLDSFAKRRQRGEAPPSAAQGAANDTGLSPTEAQEAVQGGAGASIPTARGGGIVDSMSADDVWEAKMNGMDVTDIWKATRPEWVPFNGALINKNDPRAQGGLLPDQLIPLPGGGVQRVQNQGGRVSSSLLPGTSQAIREVKRADVEETPTTATHWKTGVEYRGTPAQLEAAGVYPPKPPAPLAPGPAGVPRAPTRSMDGPAGKPGTFEDLPKPEAGVFGNFQGDPSEVMRTVMAVAANQPPQERANMLAALAQQMGQQPGTLRYTPPGGAPPAAPTTPTAPTAGAPGDVPLPKVGFSPAEKHEQEMAKLRETEEIKQAFEKKKLTDAEQKQYMNIKVSAGIAERLLKEGPTGSYVGKAADQLGSVIGMELKGQGQAAQLKAVSGWMRSNVPRMEGPQSDKDTALYDFMAGQVGDETVHAGVRLKALRTVMELRDKYAMVSAGASSNQLGGSGAPAAPAKPALSPEAKRALVQSFSAQHPPSKYKGRTATDEANNLVYRSDGMTWKEVE